MDRAVDAMDVGEAQREGSEVHGPEDVFTMRML